MPAAAVTLYLPWQRRGFNKWGPREVTTFISGDTPDSIANLVTPPQRHYQSVYRTLPHALRARAPRVLRRLVLCGDLFLSSHVTHIHARKPARLSRKYFQGDGTITHLRDTNSFIHIKREQCYIYMFEKKRKNYYIPRMNRENKSYLWNIRSIFSRSNVSQQVYTIFTVD